MKRILVSLLSVALIMGAVYGSAATISVSGVDSMGAGSVSVSNIHTGASCSNPTGVVSGSVTCSSINVP